MRKCDFATWKIRKLTKDWEYLKQQSCDSNSKHWHGFDMCFWLDWLSLQPWLFREPLANKKFLWRSHMIFPKRALPLPYLWRNWWNQLTWRVRPPIFPFSDRKVRDSSDLFASEVIPKGDMWPQMPWSWLRLLPPWIILDLRMSMLFLWHENNPKRNTNFTSRKFHQADSSIYILFFSFGVAGIALEAFAEVAFSSPFSW